MLDTACLNILLLIIISLLSLVINLDYQRRIQKLQNENNQTAHLLKHAQSSLIDMGVQLRNSIPAFPPINPGYVYVLQSASGYYKIGKTADPKDRARTFNVKLPFEVDYIVLIKTGNMTALENYLHQQFAHKRGRGEWFALSSFDLDYLKSIPGNLVLS